ncbi:MAG: hypothetical protein WC988_02500 [Patescibacteria group bacterium]
MLPNKFNFGLDSRTRNYAGEAVEALLNFMVPIILVALSLATFALYISPTYKSLPILNEEINTKTQEVSVLQAKVDQLKSLQDNKNLVVSDLVKMSWALEERDKVPELSEQVRLMSKDAGVVFSSLDYSNTNRGNSTPVTAPSAGITPDPELYREEKVNVSVNSTNLSELIKFLKISENSIRLFRIESLRISTREKVRAATLVMSSPYLNPSFSSYSQSAAPIDLKNVVYRDFMTDLDSFSNYAQKIDSTLPKI